MRITFFILLLANLVLVLWQTQIQPRQGGEQALPQIPENKRLVLVKEQHQESEIVAEDAEDAEIEEPEDTETAVASTSSDLGLPEIEITGSVVTLDADLLDEPEPEPEAVIPVLQCYTMGPFKDLGHTKAVTGRLSDIGAGVSRRSKVEQEQYGYRVYLKPYGTREEAAAEARKLAERGVRDYYIISDDPEKKNGISLGLFRKKSGAIRRMAQVRRFDFKPHMEIRYRDTTIYWLDFEHLEDVDSQALWRELTEETPELQRLDRDCE